MWFLRRLTLLKQPPIESAINFCDVGIGMFRHLDWVPVSFTVAGTTSSAGCSFFAFLGLALVTDPPARLSHMDFWPSIFPMSSAGMAPAARGRCRRSSWQEDHYLGCISPSKTYGLLWCQSWCTLTQQLGNTKFPPKRCVWHHKMNWLSFRPIQNQNLEYQRRIRKVLFQSSSSLGQSSSHAHNCFDRKFFTRASTFSSVQYLGTKSRRFTPMRPDLACVARSMVRSTTSATLRWNR